MSSLEQQKKFFQKDTSLRRGRREGASDQVSHEHYAAGVREALLAQPARIDNAIRKTRDRMVNQCAWPGGPALIARLLRLRTELFKVRDIAGKRKLVEEMLVA